MNLNYNTLKSIFFKFDPETAHKIAEVAMVGANKIFTSFQTVPADAKSVRKINF